MWEPGSAHLTSLLVFLTLARFLTLVLNTANPWAASYTFPYWPYRLSAQSPIGVSHCYLQSGQKSRNGDVTCICFVPCHLLSVLLERFKWMLKKYSSSCKRIYFVLWVQEILINIMKDKRGFSVDSRELVSILTIPLEHWNNQECLNVAFVLPPGQQFL